MEGIREQKIVIPHQGEEIYEERYVTATKKKRFFAFLIDFIIFSAIVYLLNTHVTTPYIYNPIFDYDTKIQRECEIAGNYNLAYIDNGACVFYDVPEDENSLEYGQYYANLIKFQIDPELQKIDKQLRKIPTLSRSIDSLFIVLLVYVLPALIFKKGQTIGKKIMNLIVIDSFGEPVKLFQYLFREIVGLWALVYVPSFLLVYLPLLLFGTLCLYFSKKQRTIYDAIFGTYVVENRKELRLIEFEAELVEEELLEEEEETLKTIDGEDYY